MKASTTSRGFVVIEEENYQDGEMTRLIQESSTVGDYDDSPEKPGSSYLWVGQDHHLDREQVTELISRMQHWLLTGRLAVDEDWPDSIE